MKELPEFKPVELPCGTCVSDYTAEALNQKCFCVAIEPAALRAELEPLLLSRGVSGSMAKSHQNLFASLPVYIPQLVIAQIAAVVAAIEEVTALPAYRLAAMAWAPDIAKKDPGSPGGLLGLDFHLASGGARLIEINTNPGGVLLNAMLGQAQRICMPETMASPSDVSVVEAAVMAAIETEWRLQRGNAPLVSIAIVDNSPDEQYLYPEFLLFQKLFRQHRYRTTISSPDALEYKDGRLWHDDAEVDMIYNRLTDFALQEPANRVLREAYLAGDVVLSPHPHAHALYADKRNLTLLSDSAFLAKAGATSRSMATLSDAIPSTVLVSLENREWLWTNRRNFFFKPAAGYGSKAAYRGDKLTHRVWDEIAAGTFVAQELVKPSERHMDADSSPLKVDIRCYVYRGEILLYAARLYQGQTTNFRTPLGGFAPVLTIAESRAEKVEVVGK